MDTVSGRLIRRGNSVQGISVIYTFLIPSRDIVLIIYLYRVREFLAKLQYLLPRY